jgi:hypothetical protein
MTVFTTPQTARTATPLRRIGDRALMTDQQRAQAYEAAKASWQARHPEASADQYEAAIQDIARRLGV